MTGDLGDDITPASVDSLLDCACIWFSSCITFGEVAGQKLEGVERSGFEGEGRIGFGVSDISDGHGSVK